MFKLHFENQWYTFFNIELLKLPAVLSGFAHEMFLKNSFLTGVYVIRGILYDSFNFLWSIVELDDSELFSQSELWFIHIYISSVAIGTRGTIAPYGSYLRKFFIIII